MEVNCLLLTLFFGPGTRDPGLALSTFYRRHRRYGFLFVSGDDHKVPLLNRAQTGVGETGIGFVPVKAREVLLGPGIFENLTVTRGDLVAHLAHVFKEQALKQGWRDGFSANGIVQIVFVLDDGFDVDFVAA